MQVGIIIDGQKMRCYYKEKELIRVENRVLDHKSVLSMLPDRDPCGHKGDYGKLLMICGSRGYTGAPALASIGALRCGAGLVFLSVPDCIYAIEAAKLTEPVILPLPDNGKTVSASAWKEISNRMLNADAVLVGCGLGISADTEAIVTQILSTYPGTVVLDADGINVLCNHKDIIRGRTGRTILTPHEGEFIRFGGRLELGREAAAAEMARDLGAIVVLKGHRTVTTDGAVCYVNPTGNPGMAVGGSGDVLAGMITGLLGQGLPPLEAAACGVWLHGAAGDCCAEKMGQYGMLPTDMLEVLPQLLK